MGEEPPEARALARGGSRGPSQNGARGDPKPHPAHQSDMKVHAFLIVSWRLRIFLAKNIQHA
jgi:hypothetical protein